jgi:glycosyltransferase involved in cell wall biosynthesis
MVGYIAAASGGTPHVVTDTRGLRVTPQSFLRLLIVMLSMAFDRIAAPGRIHHIHVAGRGSTLRKLILAATARWLGCIHLLHLHDFDYATYFTGRSAWLKAQIRWMFQNAEFVIVLGGRDRDTVIQMLGVAPNKVVVLRNCVPDPGPRSIPANRSEAMILFLGRLSERKGVPELLEALSRPVLSGLPWRAVLAGDGPVEQYRRQAASLGLADRISLPGWLGEAEIRELRAQADILVLPSHGEGMAMAVLEGLASGLAVVTTRVGAHEEVITDGATGVFVPVGDADALAAVLARLVGNPDERDRLSEHGRALYLNRFNMAAYMDEITGIYGHLIGRDRTAVAAGRGPA